MVIMDPYYSADRLQDTWRNISQLHLSYLDMEDSQEKLEHREKLEDCIQQFLCIATHTQKFCFRETAEVLYRSASSKKDFSGYKAATGWNAIQMYAGNLLAQPWRKEYRTIKTYSGFYKHQIEANLVGADLMFEAMGYKHSGNGILVLDGPICPDRVSTVSKDCLIAYVECQILKVIWEELSPLFTFTWLEVLQFRKNHLCSPEQAVRALNYQFHQNQYQATETLRNHQSAPKGMPFSPMTAHPHMPPAHTSTTLQGFCPNTCCAGNNYATYAHVPYMPMSFPPPITNGYYCANGFVAQTPTMPVYTYGVPTAQLIELENTNHQYNENFKGYDVVDRASSNHEVPSTKPSAKTSGSLKGNTDTSEEDWGYVYRKLESTGYSKDLGERGDVLSPNSLHRKTRPPTNLSDAFQTININSDSRPLTFSEAFEKYGKTPQVVANLPEKPKRRHSQGSSYENLAPEPKPTSANGTVINNNNNYSSVKTKTLPARDKTKSPAVSREITVVATAETGSSKTLDNGKLNSGNRWECKTCTYLNQPGKDICEMCSKSRCTVDQRMEIGGAECSWCTLCEKRL